MNYGLRRAISTALVAVVIIIVVIAAGVGVYLATTTSKSTTTSTTTSTTIPTTSTTSSSTTTSTTIPTTSTTSSSTTTSSSSVSSSSSSSTNCSTPVNIGVMEDEEGSIATFANETIHMAQIAVNQINAEGGVDCHQLKLYSADETTSASAAANTLVLQDHISALVGISYTSDAEAIFPFLSSNHIITIMTTASVDNLLANLTTDYSAYQYFFRITATTQEEAQSVVNFSASVIKPSSIYFVAEDESFQYVQFSEISSDAVAAGIPVVGSVFVPLSQTSFTTTAAEVAAVNPSEVIDCQTGSGAGSFISDLAADAPNIKVVYMCNGALSDPGFQEYLQHSGAATLNGVMYQIEAGTRTVPVNNFTTWLSTQYTDVMGSPYYSFPANAYSAVLCLANAMRAAGTVSNTTAIIQALTTVSTDGPLGTMIFNSQHIWTPEFWYTQIQNETEKVIYPSTVANGSYNATA